MRPLTQDAAAKAVAADIAAIVAALSANNGNVQRTATSLGIPERTLRRRIVAYGLSKWLSATYSRSVRQTRRNAAKSK